MITIGVPVYNGEDFLDECLNCLQRQTYKEFVVKIFDNASTDATPEIINRYTTQDSRFEVYRHTSTIPPGENFSDAVDSVQTPYFLWRAHDDLSADNYLEVLKTLLDNNESANLASSKIISERLVGDQISKRRQIDFRCHYGEIPINDLPINLKYVHQSWFYGLWRSPAAKDTWHRIYNAYPHPWASDFLMLFTLLLRGEIVGSNHTHFQQRQVQKPFQHSTQRATLDASTMRIRRAEFYKICYEEAGLDNMPLLKRLRFKQSLENFCTKRVYSKTKILKAELARKIQWAARSD